MRNVVTEKTKILTIEDVLSARIHGERFTNLGPGFHLDLGGATSITIHRRGENTPDGSRAPSIDWINTYGNVSANVDSYAFGPAAARYVSNVLDQIERRMGR